MKKILALCSVLILILTIFASCNNNKTTSTGRCLVTIDNQYLIVMNNSPVVMSNQSRKDNLFEEIKTGDMIKITHDGINESYPGQTGVYSCSILKTGTISDISKEVISSLNEMGWTFK